MIRIVHLKIVDGPTAGADWLKCPRRRPREEAPMGEQEAPTGAGKAAGGMVNRPPVDFNVGPFGPPIVSDIP